MHLPNPISTLPLLTSTLLLLSLTTPIQSAYTLKDDYTPSTFFSQFTFFTDDDPTHGYVDYISQSAASSAGLINTNNNQIYMGVDSTNIGSGRGRKSVRITSKAVYNHALIILDLEHMPGSICGVWPAFWTVGPSWPSSGEIDIIEGVSGQVGNSMALHTGPGCSVGGSGSGGNTSPNTGSAQSIFSGTIKTPDCNVAAAGQPTNAGCAITTSDASTYGSGLNNANGGVYATEWNSNVIRVWFFPRGQIPADIDSQSPSPNSWGAPLASFGSGSCDIDAAFKDQQIVFDTTFCGDWAGSVWSSDPMCSGKAATCQDYVRDNPGAFGDAYWAVNHLKVYTGEDGGAAPSAVPSGSASVSRPVGSGVPTGSGSQMPIGPSTTPGGVPKPVPVPEPGVSTTTGLGQTQQQPQPQPTAATTAATNSYNPPIATSQPQVPAPVPQPSQSQQPQPQIPTNLNPTIPPTAIPTTMATSRTNNWGGNSNSNSNGNSNSYSWGGNGYGNGNGYTRTRGWNGPPRMGKWAAPEAAVDVAVDGAGAGTDAGNTGLNPWEAVHVRSISEDDSGTVETNGSGSPLRSLIRPVVRRDGAESPMVVESGSDGEQTRRDISVSVRRSHLGRHKERRWGHEHGHGHLGR